MTTFRQIGKTQQNAYKRTVETKREAGSGAERCPRPQNPSDAV